MTHSEMDEIYELYVLGVLEPEVAAEIDQHLGDQCAHCLERLADATLVATAMCGMADVKNPPASLRNRVLSAVRPPARRRGWMYAFGVMAAASLALLFWGIRQSARLDTLLRESSELRSAVEVLSRHDAKAVQFGIAENVPHGRVFVSKSGGVVFVGSQLPPVASDHAYELWLIPVKGAPQAAGVFRSNAAGNSVNVLPQSVDTAAIQAIAVSIEPSAGSSAPTTKPILVVPLS